MNQNKFQGKKLTSEAIIADHLGRGPDMVLQPPGDGWCLARWRQFVGSYDLPALPTPLFVVHIAGKPRVRTWMQGNWSESFSAPSQATIVPGGLPTRWLVDGELDVVTFSPDMSAIQGTPGLDKARRMRFAFSDPLGTALTQQLLAECYEERTPERAIYIDTLLAALKAHVTYGSRQRPAEAIPTADCSAYRVHNVINSIQRNPGADHSLEDLAARAGLTSSHFCRVFKKATGESPHQFVMRVRLERAQQLLVQTDLGLGELSDTLGFASQSHFTRIFRQATGRTPSAYRRNKGSATLQ